jgi:hypothetical protein
MTDSIYYGPNRTNSESSNVLVQRESISHVIGRHENRLGFRGALVRQVLKVFGNRATIQINSVQIEVRKAIDDPRRDGSNSTTVAATPLS